MYRFLERARTIADNIDFLNEAKKLFEDIANNPRINETVKTYFIIESLENAIDIMRKYQKIEHIVKAEIPYKLVEIEKVVEDGKID